MVYYKQKKYVKGRPKARKYMKVYKPMGNRSLYKPIRWSKYRDGQNVKLIHEDMNLINQNTNVDPEAPPIWNVQASGAGFTSVTTSGVSNYFGANTQDVTGSFLWRLGNTLQWDQFRTMYDRVRLNGVKITFIPQFANSLPTSSIASIAPTIKLVTDFDDANAPSTYQAIMARQGKIRRLNKPFSIYVKPRCRSSVLQNVQGGGYSVIPGESRKPGFIDTATAANVSYFSTKFGIRDWTIDAPLKMKVVATYYVTFRNLLWNPPVTISEKPSEELSNILLDEEEAPCETQQAQPKLTIKIPT